MNVYSEVCFMKFLSILAPVYKVQTKTKQYNYFHASDVIHSRPKYDNCMMCFSVCTFKLASISPSVRVKIPFVGSIETIDFPIEHARIICFFYRLLMSVFLAHVNAISPEPKCWSARPLHTHNTFPSTTSKQSRFGGSFFGMVWTFLLRYVNHFTHVRRAEVEE